MMSESLSVSEEKGLVSTWNVTGTIFDSSDAPLLGVTITLVMNATSEPVTNPLFLEDATYEAWTQSPYETAVLFQKKGYKDLKIQFIKLVDSPDVVMQKGTSFEPWMIILVAGAALLIITRKKKENKVGFIETGDVLTIFLLIGGILGISVVVSILKKLGLMGDKPVRDEQEDPNSAWKPSYWRQFSSYSYAITTAQAEQFAKTIHNAFGLIQDDFNQVMNVFNQLRTKANVSFLADVFQAKYSEDLLSFLGDGGGVLPWDGLSTSHMNTVLSYVKNLKSN